MTGHLRNAVAEALCNCSSRNTLGSNNNLDLDMVSDGNTRNTRQDPYLHRAVVDLDTVQLARGLGGASRLGEDNSGSTTTAAARSVGEHDLLHSSHRFAEVVLNKFLC
jgi:hypothetical protein